MKVKLIASLILTTCISLACSKTSETPDDKVLPTISLSSPTPNQVVSGGSSVDVTGSISDDNKLSEIHVHISNNTTGVLLIDIHRYPGASSYSLNESFQAQAGISYKIQVIAKDNSANENRATVEISAN